MASYIIRVVLHNSARDDYERLYEALALIGVNDEISAFSGELYKLPPAEYLYVGPEHTSEVCDMVRAVADDMGKSSQILVTELASISWSGLDRV